MLGTLDRRTAVKSVVGFVVAVVLLYFFTSYFGWGSIREALADTDPAWLAPAVVAALAALVIWAKVWDETLAVLDVDIPYRSLIPTYYAATFADYATPFGKVGGGPVVAYVLSTDRRATYQEGLASVLVTNGLNLLPFFTFAGFGVIWLAVTGAVPATVRPLLYGLGALALGLPIGAYVLWRHDQVLIPLVARLLEPVARRTDRLDAQEIEAKVAEFFTLLDTLAQSPTRLAETLVFSYLGWVCFAAPLWFAGRALGVSLSPLLVAFVVPASSLASFVPTPGGVGGVEAALVAMLIALAGLAPGMAAAVVLLYRGVGYWLILLVGGVATGWVVYQH